MRQRLVTALVVLCLFSLPAAAAAQHRQPHAGAIAIGGDAGVYVPGSEFHAGFNPDVFVEFYFFHWLSLRGMAAYTAPNFDYTDNELRQYRGNLELLVNWETGLWHPYVLLGGGGYVFQPRAGGQPWGDEQTRGGGTLGIGIEYFARPKIALKFETTYHFIGQGSLPGRPSGLAMTVGIKKYFF